MGKTNPLDADKKTRPPDGHFRPERRSSNRGPENGHTHPRCKSFTFEPSALPFSGHRFEAHVFLFSGGAGHGSRRPPLSYPRPPLLAITPRLVFIRPLCRPSQDGRHVCLRLVFARRLRGTRSMRDTDMGFSRRPPGDRPEAHPDRKEPHPFLTRPGKNMPALGRKQNYRHNRPPATRVRCRIQKRTGTTISGESL